MCIVSRLPEPLMTAVITSQRGIRHGRHIVFTLRITCFQQLKIILEDYILAFGMGIRKWKCSPARIRNRSRLGTSPADIGTLAIVIEDYILLVFLYNRKDICSSQLRTMTSTIIPNDNQVTITGHQLFRHTFTHFIIEGLSVFLKFSTVFRHHEIMYSQKRIPTDTDIDTRPNAIFPARIDEITNNIPLAVFPL